MRLMILLSLFMLVALLTAGCEFEKYDDHMAACEVSGREYKVTVYATRDSDELRHDYAPAEFLRACAELQKAGLPNRSIDRP